MSSRICARLPGRGSSLLVASLSLASPAFAQSSGPGASSELDRVEELANAGKSDEARAVLDAWFGAAASLSAGAVSRARLLRARLAADPASAEEDYVWVAIEGDAAHAPEAWLRLSQLRLLRGDADRALSDLERLRASHPGDPRTGESWLWSGHAHEALGELDEACAAWKRADPSDASMRSAVEEVLTACEETGTVYAVQVGAFGVPSGAETTRHRMDEAGFVAYVVRGSEDGLYRVRTGKFVHMTSAALFAERVRRSGFDAVVVLASRASG